MTIVNTLGMIPPVAQVSLAEDRTLTLFLDNHAGDEMCSLFLAQLIERALAF